MKIFLVLMLMTHILFAYKIKNSDGNVIFFVGGENNNRVSINCGETIDEDYALKVCGKVMADDFVKDTVTLDFKDSDDSLEGDETNDDHEATITLELNKASANDVTFHFETKDNSADGNDYDTVDDDFKIAAGDTSVDINIPIKGDKKAEDDEIIDIEISSVKNAELADSTATYTILNDDKAPKVQLLGDAQSDAEGTTFHVTASTDAKVSGDVTVEWEIKHKDTNDNDFDDLSGSFTIADGTDSKSFDVATKDDDAFGADESFIVRLKKVSDGDAVLGSDKDQEITITNDDDEPTLSIDDESVEEGDDDKDVDFEVKLSVAAEIDVTVDVDTEHDTTDDDDIDPDPDKVTKFTFKEGETSQTFTVTVKGDDDEEEDETYYVQMNNAKNATDGGDATGTITNDDSSGGWFSDRRLKKDITPLKNPLEKLEQIQGVTFHWRDKKRGEREEVGVIAQDVEKVYPQVVEMGSDGYRRVQYQLLVAPLIEALKELKQENEILQQRVRKLEQK